MCATNFTRQYLTHPRPFKLGALYLACHLLIAGKGFLGTFKTLRSPYYVFSVRLSVCPDACNNYRTPGRILIKIDVREFYKKMHSIFNFHFDRTYLTTILHED
jgi:hypothetical protein